MPSSPQDDESLMKDLQAGDHSALTILIQRWERPLYSFAYRYVQNDATARDIVEETMVRLFTKRDRFNTDRSLSSWIFTVAANLCRNYSRWRKRHPEDSIDATDPSNPSSTNWHDSIASDSLSPNAEAEKAERNSLLRKAVLKLPHDLKVALLLHYYEELSYQEISDISGCSIRGVETRLYRARKLLKSNWKTQFH